MEQKSKKDNQKYILNGILNWTGLELDKNKWIYIADEDLEEEEDEFDFECIQLIPLFSEKDDGIKRVSRR